MKRHMCIHCGFESTKCQCKKQKKLGDDEE